MTFSDWRDRPAKLAEIHLDQANDCVSREAFILELPRVVVTFWVSEYFPHRRVHRTPNMTASEFFHRLLWIV
jgi:hypothetical protein